MKAWKMVMLQKMQEMEQMLEDCRQQEATDAIRELNKMVTGGNSLDFKRVEVALKGAINKLEAMVNRGEDA